MSKKIELDNKRVEILNSFGLTRLASKIAKKREQQQIKLKELETLRQDLMSKVVNVVKAKNELLKEKTTVNQYSFNDCTIKELCEIADKASFEIEKICFIEMQKSIDNSEKMINEITSQTRILKTWLNN